MTILADALGLPENATPRHCRLKMAQLEVETKYREATIGERDKLEQLVNNEEEKLLSARKEVLRVKRAEGDMKKAMLIHKRYAKSFKEKLSKSSDQDLGGGFAELQDQLSSSEMKVNELNKIHEFLKKFRGLSPTNESLRQAIDDLKKKTRVSLEVTFADYSFTDTP